MLFREYISLILASACIVEITVAQGAPNTAQDLSYSAMQVVQGSTSALKSAQNIPAEIPKLVSSIGAIPNSPASQNVIQSHVQIIRSSATTPDLNSAQNVAQALTSQLNRNAIQAPASVQRYTSATTSTSNSAQSNPEGITNTGSQISLRNQNSIPTPLQVIQGPTAAITSILNFAQHIPRVITQVVPLAGAVPFSPFSPANQNFQRVLVRGGLNALGEGAKAGATIASIPSNVVRSGLDEVKKVVDSRLGATNSSQPVDTKTRIVSNLMNTVSSQLSQTNIRGALVEEALKNRVKGLVNQIANVVPRTSQPVQSANVNTTSRTLQLPAIPNRVVDTLLGQFNSAVRRNDERLMQALRAVIARVDLPKNNGQGKN